MTLEEAQKDKRFEQFKYCAFIDLLSYIAKSDTYLAKQEDAEVREFNTAAKLIRDARTGNPD